MSVSVFVVVVDAKPKLQASLLWGAVAKVLDDEVLDGDASERMARVMALFAICQQTMEPRRKIITSFSFRSLGFLWF